MLGVTPIDLTRTWMRTNCLQKGELLSIGMQKDGTLETQNQKSPEPEEGGLW
jgi:hypothetical protein